MKTINLRIGKRGGPFITVPIQEPETAKEFLSLHNNSEGYLVKTANRGRRIDIQDEGRDLVAELTEAGKPAHEIAEAVLAHLGTVDLTQKKARGPGKPKGPKQVTIKKMPTSMDELKKLLEAQGVVVTA